MQFMESKFLKLKGHLSQMLCSSYDREFLLHREGAEHNNSVAGICLVLT